MALGTARVGAGPRGGRLKVMRARNLMAPPKPEGLADRLAKQRFEGVKEAAKVREWCSA